MDLTFINEYFIPIVLIGCLVVGYCIKKLDNIDNKYIPTIVAILGAIIACVDAKGFALTPVIAGAVTGLASTGCYEAFTQLIEKK